VTYNLLGHGIGGNKTGTRYTVPPDTFDSMLQKGALHKRQSTIGSSEW
jgi:hypothetical protein